MKYGYANNSPWRNADPSGKITKVFSRPTDDPGEFVKDSDGNQVPYETARITVTVTPDLSNCKCEMCTYSEFGSEPPYAGSSYERGDCRGTVTLQFSYSAVIKSVNGDNPARSARDYGIEVDNIGFFADPFFRFTVTVPPGGGIVGTIVDGIAESEYDCSRNRPISLSCDDRNLSQSYYIRSEFGSGPINYWYEEYESSYHYKLSYSCETQKVIEETLDGKMETDANGPLRDISVDGPYPPSPN